MKLIPELLHSVNYPMQLVSLNLDTLGRSYDCFTLEHLLETSQ
jgi:hypothetical protein